MADGTHESMADRRERYTGTRIRTKSFSVGDLPAHNKSYKSIKSPAMPIFDEQDELTGPPQLKGRMIMVSNRLSVTVKQGTKDDGSKGDYVFSPSSGGLATGLAGMMKTTEFMWYGWPGLEIPPEEQDAFRKKCITEHEAYPVFMSAELSDRHYNGFSNEILWPLFHYHPQDIEFDEYNWEGYKEANQVFAETVARDVRDNDVVWVQDYHLMLLPAMLRQELEKMPNKPRNVKIGFFLHTPFPSSEVYRVLPVRGEILEGVLHSDLIGFHIIDYVRHFLNACSRVLGLYQWPNAVQYQGKIVEVRPFPIGIEPETFLDGLDNTKIQKRTKELDQSFKGFKTIVGVDRLDYIKGILQKLNAFDVFLTDHPEWRKKVQLIQIAVPSRGDVEEYQNLRVKVNELVGHLNGKYGTVEYTPVRFLHQTVPQPELIALYTASDVCLVTSTRDGMNLVSFEFIACQRDRQGVLVLSEFAGAASQLHGALQVNPWDQDDVADKIYQAVKMTDCHVPREQNYEKMMGYVGKFTSLRWSHSFLKALTQISERGEEKLKQLRTREEEEMSVQSPAASVLSLDVGVQPPTITMQPQDSGVQSPSSMAATSFATDSAYDSTTESQQLNLEKTGQGRADGDDSDSDNEGGLMMKPSPRGGTPMP